MSDPQLHVLVFSQTFKCTRFVQQYIDIKKYRYICTYVHVCTTVGAGLMAMPVSNGERPTEFMSMSV